MQFPNSGLYPLTPANPSSWNTWLVTTTLVVRAGIGALQLRVEDTTPRDAFTELRKECSKNKVPLIVNNDLALADFLEADGVHLGKDDPEVKLAREVLGPHSIIGVSCYDSSDRALKAIQEGANYVAFGRMFPSETKPEARACSLEVLGDAARNLDVPVVAIGGITPENVSILLKRGAKLVAVGHSIFGHDKPVVVVEQFRKALKM